MMGHNTGESIVKYIVDTTDKMNSIVLICVMSNTDICAPISNKTQY